MVAISVAATPKAMVAQGITATTRPTTTKGQAAALQAPTACGAPLTKKVATTHVAIVTT